MSKEGIPLGMADMVAPFEERIKEIARKGFEKHEGDLDYKMVSERVR